MNTLKKCSLIAFLALSFSAMAQPDPPGNPAPLPGLVWLAVAGAAYGAKKVYDKKKEAE